MSTATRTRARTQGPRPRSLWLTVPLHLILLAVLAVDVWAAVFWVAVGGTIGLWLAAGAGVVVVLLALLVVVDGRRQWRLHRWSADGG